MMKLKNNEVYNIFEVLNKIKDMEVPIRLGYSLSKIVRTLSPQLQLLEEQRNNIIKKYGHDVDNGFAIDTDDQYALRMYVDEYSELLGIEEEYDITPIPLELLINSDIRLTTNELDAIYSIIEE